MECWQQVWGMTAAGNEGLNIDWQSVCDLAGILNTRPLDHHTLAGERSPLASVHQSSGGRRRSEWLRANWQWRHEGNLRRMLPEAWGTRPLPRRQRHGLQVAVGPCRVENVPSSSRERDPDPLVGFLGAVTAIIHTGHGPPSALRMFPLPLSHSLQILLLLPPRRPCIMAQEFTVEEGVFLLTPRALCRLTFTTAFPSERPRGGLAN